MRKGHSSRKTGDPLDNSARDSRQVTVSTTRRRSRPRAESSSPNIDLTLKHFHRRNGNEGALTSGDGKRLYLRVGDEVNHLRYEEWGLGVVMEVMTSSVPGGTCLARVRFQDGQLRCFNNDLDNQACCYYFGVRRYWNPTEGVEAIRTQFFLRR